MNALIIQILEILTPVFAIVAVGAVWVRSGVDFDVAFITRLCMNIGGPCLVFSTLATVDLDPAAFQAMAMAGLTLYAFLILGFAALLAAMRLPLRLYLAPFSFGNTGNLGLPICLFAYGDAGLAFGIIVFALTVALAFTLGVWLVAGVGDPTAALKQPLFYAAALGALVAHQGWRVPEIVLSTTSLAGQILIPLMLLMLGASIARLKVVGLARALGFSVLRFAYAAAAGVTAASLFDLSDTARGVLILQAVMPVAVTSYLLAERYDAAPQDIAALVVVSSFLSVLLLPPTLALLL